MASGDPPGRRTDGLTRGVVPHRGSPCHAVWDIAIFHQYDTAPNLGAGPGVASTPSGYSYGKCVSSSTLGATSSLLVVRLAQEHAPGQPQRANAEPLRCLVAAHRCTSIEPLLARSTVTQIGWPMERARSVFETPARFGRATLNGLTPLEPLGTAGWRPCRSSPPFPFPSTR